MSSPNGESPAGSLAAGLFASWQAQTENEQRSILKIPTISKWEQAQDTLHEADAEIWEALSRFEDSQLELNDRADLLDGVRGYCNSYLGANWTVGGNADKQLPFDSQIGPPKGAELYSGVGIKLLEKGLWRADVHLSFQVQSGWFTGAALASVFLTVRPTANPSSVYTRRQYSLVIGRAGDETAAFSHTFVIPDDDAYFVTVELNHKNTRQTVFGGTVRSALSVNKWDFRIDNAVVAPTVPDGGTL